MKNFDNIKPGDRIEIDVLVTSSEVVHNNGKCYLNINVSDGKRELNAKMWNFIEDLQYKPNPNDILFIDAMVQEYAGKLSLIIANFYTSQNKSTEDFIPKGPNDVNKLRLMYGEFRSNNIIDEDYNNVLDIIEERYYNLYDCPSAVGHHHAYYGGNMQHTLEVCMIAKNIISAFTVMSDLKVNNELVYMGALVHDIGKLECYRWNGIVPEMTDSGKYSDHIQIGYHTLRSICEEVAMEPSKMNKLLAIVTSHHENLEWGSPVKPCFPEALIVARADNLSAGVTAMTNEIEEQLGEWGTKKSFKFGAFLHKDV